MEVMTVLHMNKGTGETSYAKNSTLQSKIISVAKPFVEEAILEVLCSNIPESLGIADLGCSSGPNTLSVISEVIDIVHAKCVNMRRLSPEIRVYLNDLPGNDFNNIFMSLPEFHKKLKVDKGAGFGPCFVSGMPGSFYGRLFPRKSLHFVHSSSSLHWLSQVPSGLDGKAGPTLNKGKLYISKTSPECVARAYADQFKRDFVLYLESRSAEMVTGGRMVLSLMGRISNDPSAESAFLWELLSLVLMAMASKGLVEETKVDSFNAPYYAPSTEELKSEITREGSFTIDYLETFEASWDYFGCGEEYVPFSGERVAKMVRAVVESMLESHFGGGILVVMDELFRRYAEMVDDHLSKNRAKNILVVVSLTRREAPQSL
ncbi:probable jasmonic acid carboxyl methyltransferase 2 [Syzygium oleosum]|uniref:probable jasmonic acid carboxyl methyltransferase 2 n=1 Tax=Syzygium oleosum TaxID=219896 RepID=UPI0011D27037|nr:probable jasmonic acid carboxyl methyltransferase 2 [Syzygium oleosum]